MRIENGQLRIQDLLLSLSHIADLIDPAINKHHRYVAYISYRLAKHLGFARQDLQDIVLAASLHDIGAFSARERLELLEFECAGPVHQHAEAGYRLLRDFAPLSNAANLIRHHHALWKPDQNTPPISEEIPPESFLLHLADRIAVLINPGKDILFQASNIRKQIDEQSGRMFMPRMVTAFQDLASREEFWLDILYEPIESTLSNSIDLEPVSLDTRQFESLTELFRRIIDFRSMFTATHSSGVAATAEALASLVGFSPSEARTMRLAGHLHDLGKLAIPTEILEKNNMLDPVETSIIRTHTYHTHRMLLPLKSMDTIRIWAALHHERPDGKGYPFHIKGSALSLGSRIMAVADVFTALTEDRPYRLGLPPSEALEIVERMVGNHALDAEVVSLVTCHAADVNSARRQAQENALAEYYRYTNSAN